MRVDRLLTLGVCLLLLASAGAEEKKAKFDASKLEGTWTYVSGERNGDKVAEDRLKSGTVVITKDKITLKGDETFVIAYKLDPAKDPCRISMEIKEGSQGVGAKSEGIITVKDDELKLCYAMPEQEAPKEFSAKKDSNHHLFILKRKK